MSQRLDARASRLLLRAQLLGALVLAAGIGASLARDVGVSADVPFLSRRDAPWIVAQTPIQTSGMQIDLAHPPMAFFARPFVSDAPEEPVILRVRGLTEVEVFLNERPLPLDPPEARSWRRVRSVDLQPYLVPGTNVIAARVRNPRGNPALQLWVEGLDERIESDARWLAAWEGDPVSNAALAEDSLRHPDADTLPAPFEALAELAPQLGAFALAGALAFLALRRAPPRLAPRAPAVALGLAALYWIAFARSALATPADVGFDAAAHLDYVDWIVTRRALPRPADGALMYHPPLYHGLTALLALALEPIGFERRTIVALLPLASGFGMAWVAGTMMRALAPGAPWLAAGAIFAAALLPMNLTVASCASNEGPFAFLASCAVLAAVQALTRPVASLRDDARLGALLGAAALAKYTILLWIPVLLGAVAAKRLLVERRGAARAAGGAALGAGIALALAGWVYARNALLAGDPLVWNLDTEPGKTWWQLPGFHTADYFVRFGDALARPWFASFHSFWDSLYTTLWGDGLLSGATGPVSAVRRWRYDAMAAGFALALPATCLLAAGWLRAAAASLRGDDGGRRIALSLLCLLPPLFGATLVTGILRWPFWSGPKAFYGLSLGPTLAVLGVLGFAALDAALARRGPLALRAAPYAWAGAFLAVVAWSFAG